MVQALAKSMMDGLKDGRMYYDYAKEAKEHKCNDLATFFIGRAKVRMQMITEDHTKVKELIKKMESEKEKPYEEGKWDCLHTYLMEEKEHLDYLISSFK